jgi:hypothetical protein
MRIAGALFPSLDLLTHLVLFPLPITLKCHGAIDTTNILTVEASIVFSLAVADPIRW